MLIQVAEVYTPMIFDMFQEQWDMSHACLIKHRNEIQPCFEYIIKLATSINVFDREREFRILLNPLEKTVSCTCKRFENFGILCCHALKILDANEIMHVPDQYILKRLTKDARSGVIMDFKGNEVVEDPKLARTMRYRQLCLKQIKLSSDAADFEQAFLLVDKAVDELIKQVAELRLKVTDVNKTDDSIAPISECSPQPTGIKKRIGKKRKRRHMSCLDQHKRQRTSSVTISQSQRSISNEAVNHPNSEVPKGYGNQMNFDVPSRSENTFSFTKFLMEPLLTPLGGSEFYGGFSNENDDQASE
ncbi:protein FAR1-RELATED SEQUENCE 5-like [Senna tora]|uniref:Protein FAR1-RELATED SEQUENCE n=1 Tax=Senna tora TaxID=362788 RepID=A0A834TVQ9_9FABA|nr:protein FAR1-RELATED SEQUENCE 5-like [Senna tora]